MRLSLLLGKLELGRKIYSMAARMSGIPAKGLFSHSIEEQEHSISSLPEASSPAEVENSLSFRISALFCSTLHCVAVCRDVSRSSLLCETCRLHPFLVVLKPESLEARERFDLGLAAALALPECTTSQCLASDCLVENLALQSSLVQTKGFSCLWNELMCC